MITVVAFKKKKKIKNNCLVSYCQWRDTDPEKELG